MNLRMKHRKINRILLFAPPLRALRTRISISPPMGLAYLGAVLEQTGRQVLIVDCLVEGWNEYYDHAIKDNKEILIGLEPDKIKKVIEDFMPDLVGVTCMFTGQRKEAQNIIKYTAEIDSDIITVMGGAHPSAAPCETLKENPNLNFVVLGEGEKSFCELIEYLEGNRPLDKLDGIGFSNDKQLEVIPKSRFIEDLDSIPFPAHHLIDITKYFDIKSVWGNRKSKRSSPILTSRGCPFRCAFCSAHCIWGYRFRPRSAENVIAEMKMLKTQYGIEEILFEDDYFNFDPKRTEEILDRMISEKFDFIWDTPNGVGSHTLSNRIIQKMKDSGCYKLNIAVESGNKYVLKHIMHKTVNLDKVKRQVSFAQKIGLEVSIFLLIGMPGETEEQIWDTFRFAAELGTFHPVISIATPHPGSPLHTECIEKGYITESPDFNWYSYVVPSIDTPTLSAKRVLELYNEGWGYLLMRQKLSRPVRFFFHKIFQLIFNPKAFFSSLKNLRLLLRVK